MMLRRTLIQWLRKQADSAAFTLERREQNRRDEERFSNSPRTRMQMRHKRLQAAYLQAFG
jgi:hypothetical protein